MTRKTSIAVVIMGSLFLLGGAPGTKIIEITLTYVDSRIVWDPPGPYFYSIGDTLRVTNNTGFEIRLDITKDDGTVLHGSEIFDGYTGSFPFATGLEAWVCVTYTPPQRVSETEECEQLSVTGIPAVTEWGLLSLAALLAGVGILILVRFRRAV